jgi:hypothetical protein
LGPLRAKVGEAAAHSLYGPRESIVENGKIGFINQSNFSAREKASQKLILVVPPV